MAYPDQMLRTAFMTRLLSLPSVPAIARENEQFTPPANAPYLRPTLGPGEPFQAELGESGQNRHVGIYQISVFYPAKTGTAAAGALVASIVAHFKRGTTLVHAGQPITITKAYASAMRQDTGLAHIPITIEYRLLAPN
ncbi:MAG: phage tail terminator-like protein [Geobacteraceae bacterium]|nr:phage tail terminator-like protein [Geobacteraceae bacterium]